MGCFARKPVLGNKLWGDYSKIVALGPKFHPKWDPGRSGSLPNKKKVFFKGDSISFCHHKNTSCGDNILPLHHISPSI